MKAYFTSKRNLPTAPNRHLPRRRQLASLCLLAAALLWSAIPMTIEPAAAAITQNVLSALNGKQPPADGQNPVAADADIRIELKGKLDEAQAFHDRLESGSPEAKAPAGVKPEEVTEQRRVVDSLIFFYQEGLNSLDAIAAEQDKSKSLEAQARDWNGFPDPPPYSMLLLYGLQDEADALRGKQAVLESSLAGWQADSANLRAEVTRAQADARLASDNADRVNTPTETAPAIWRRDQAQLRARAAERNLWFKEIQTALVNAKLATAKAEQDLLNKKITLAKAHAVLSEADVDKIHAGLKSAAGNLEAELQKAVAEKMRWSKEREAAARNLDSARAELARGGDQVPDPPQIATLQARLRTADAWVAAINHETEGLASLTLINNNIGDFWNYQYTLQNSAEPKLRQNAFNQLQRDLLRLQQWGSYAQNNLSLAVSEERNQQAKLELIADDSPLRRYELQTLESYRLKRQTAERIRLQMDRAEQMLARWLDDYRQGAMDRPFSDRMVDGLRDAKDISKQLLRFELFTVDEDVNLEGKKVKITHGVTLGRLFLALVVFLLGFRLAQWVARRFQMMLVLRFDIQEAQSNVLRRWVLMGLTSLLLVMVLSWASIPLTAFAFLGGALAIGVGIGTQTILKNLVSGVMILVEHKIKVGDIVEVDTIVGTITEIDIRSSTVRGFDGVETMIPNSAFLESKVTNWTYTNLKVRRTVRVGVSYGSNVREVIQLLLDCATRHGQALEEPKPYVLLEDFGENALVFGLYFWVEMKPKVSSLQIMSDLRCMIIDALAKAGIAIPFPQRDLHFDPARPLSVSVGTGIAANRVDNQAFSPHSAENASVISTGLPVKKPCE